QRRHALGGHALQALGRLGGQAELADSGVEDERAGDGAEDGGAERHGSSSRSIAFTFNHRRRLGRCRPAGRYWPDGRRARPRCPSPARTTMSALALALVLLAALCHAVWNLAAKRVADGGFAFVWCYDVASVVLWAPLALVVLARSDAGILPVLLPAALVSGLIHVAYQLTRQTGYARADLGVVYPVARGVGPVLSMAIAILVLGERPGWQAGVGAAGIVAGIVVVAIGKSAAGRRGLRAGLAWGAATG